MEFILFGSYLFFGAMANSFLKHHVLKMQTAYVFNLQNFIMEKIIWACLLGWLTIPLAALLRLSGNERS